LVIIWLELSTIMVRPTETPGKPDFYMPTDE